MKEDRRSPEEGALPAEDSHLLEGTAPFFTLLDDLHIGLIVVGPQARVLSINQEMCDIMGVTPDYMLGKTPHEWNVYDAEGVSTPYDDRLWHG